MSNDEVVNLIYGYARAACRTTPLDYRDVAHTVFINNFSRLRDGLIRHVRTYMWLAVGTTVSTMMKSKFVYNTTEMMDMADHRRANDDWLDIELICKALKPKEKFIIEKLADGFTRQEIAARLGISRIGINVIWFRLIRRLRGLI